MKNRRFNSTVLATTGAVAVLILITCILMEDKSSKDKVETVFTGDFPSVFELEGFENVVFEKYLPQSGVAFSGEGCQTVAERFSESLVKEMTGDVINDVNQAMDLFLEHANQLSLNIVEKSMRCGENDMVKRIHELTRKHFSEVLSGSEAFFRMGVSDTNDWMEFIEYFVTPTVTQKMSG